MKRGRETKVKKKRNRIKVEITINTCKTRLCYLLQKALEMLCEMRCVRLNCFGQKRTQFKI